MVMKGFLSTIFSICIYVTFATQSFAEITGISFYAMQGFSEIKCERALKSLEGSPHPAIAVLWGTFGSNTTCLEKFFERFKDKPHTLEIHPTNQTCIRSKDCEETEVFVTGSVNAYTRLLEDSNPILIDKLAARLDEIANFVAAFRNENSRIIISTGLEDDYTALGFDVMANLLKERRSITQFYVVRSPHKKFAAASLFPGADMIEAHGFSPVVSSDVGGQCIVNNDGEDIVFAGSSSDKKIRPVKKFTLFKEKYLNKGCIVFLWWGRPQGILTKKSERVPPLSRRLILRPDEIEKISKYAGF